MTHKHFCLFCTNQIEGDFDCESDTDHDFAFCSELCKRDSEKAEIANYISEAITRADICAWHEGGINAHMSELLDYVTQRGYELSQVWGMPAPQQMRHCVECHEYFSANAESKHDEHKSTSTNRFEENLTLIID